MRVLFLAGGFPSEDNPTKSIFNYRTAFSLSKKVDLTVVHFRYWKPNRNIKKIILYKGVKIVQISLPWIPVENSFLNSYNIFLWKYLCRILLKRELNNIDVIHSVGIDGMASIGSFLKRRNVKHISQTIGSDLNFHWQKIKNFKVSRGWEKNVDIFLCNSKALEEKINGEFPYNKSVTIYRGTDLTKFKPRINKNSNEKITILFLGGFANRKSTLYGKDLKGGETLKLVWKAIENRITENKMDVELVLGGPNSTELELKDWIDSLVNKHWVKCKGLIPVEKIPEEIQNADIVVIPSKAEGLPNVAVEALACNTLVIASNVGGIPEIIKDKKTGLLFDANNSSKFEIILFESITNFDKLKEIRKNGRHWVEQHFDASNYPIQLIQLYSKT